MQSSPFKSLQCPNCGANATQDSVSCAYCHTVLTVTACPSCFGALFKGMPFCPNCGAAAERSEIPGDSILACPRCEQKLTLADIAGTRIHECGSCGGIWLDAASFQKICEDKEQQEKTLAFPAAVMHDVPESVLPPKRFYIPCPVCGDLMNRWNYAGCSGVVVDLCKPHGLWFDRQELQRIVSFIKDGGLHKARARELADLKSEQDRLMSMQFDRNLDSAGLGEPAASWDLSGHASLLKVIVAIGKKLLT
jgi:Zn-finger nucleic acid-binding protein